MPFYFTKKRMSLKIAIKKFPKKYNGFSRLYLEKDWKKSKIRNGLWYLVLILVSYLLIIIVQNLWFLRIFANIPEYLGIKD